MSFKPANSRIFTPNTKSTGGKSTSKFRSSPYDRLGTIVGYGQDKDSAGHTAPTIIVEEDGSHKLYEARINADSSARAKVTRASNQNRSGNFQGNIIDELMQEKMPVGDRVVLESTTFLPRSKSVANGKEKLTVECSYITHVTEPSPTKTFRTIVTAKADFRGSKSGASGSSDSAGSDGFVRVRDYAVWGTYHQKSTQSAQTSPTSGPITPAPSQAEIRAFSSKDELRQLAADLDASNEAYQSGEMRPSLGIAFRAVVSVGAVPASINQDPARAQSASSFTHPADDAYVINESPLFDWISAVKDPDDDTKIITEGHPLDGEEFRNLYRQYSDYIFGDPESDPPTSPQEFVSQLSPEATVKIEVIAYHRYLASSYSKFNQMSSNPYHPLRRLCFTSSKYAQEDTYYHQGHNVAVAGIMMLAGDKFDKAEGSIIPRNIVSRVFFNAPTGSLHAFVRTSDGKKAHLHPSLDDPNRFKPRTPASGQAAESSASASQSGAPASMGSFASDNSGAEIPARDSSSMEASSMEPAPMDNGDFFAQLLNAHEEGEGPAPDQMGPEVVDPASASIGSDEDDLPFGESASDPTGETAGEAVASASASSPPSPSTPSAPAKKSSPRRRTRPSDF